jgi:SAM-dependent methyltransferase
MSSYRGLSPLYDEFMQDAPYLEWETWLTNQFNLASVNVADLGCGTGRLTLALSPLCKTIVGVDLSEEMLSQAAERAATSKIPVQWYCQDMRRFRLPHVVDIVLSTCDCVNYLLTPDDLRACFSRVHENLAPHGWFCFDVLGNRRLQTLENGFWYDLQPEAAVLFETSLDRELGRISYEVHAFFSEDGRLYRRVEEHHEQAFHHQQGLVELLQACGFAVRSVLGDFGKSSLEDSDRWVFMAQKQS